MQREVQALFRAYMDERDRETQLIRELLAALAVGSDARRRMIMEITAAVEAIRAIENSHVGSDIADPAGAPRQGAMPESGDGSPRRH